MPDESFRDYVLDQLREVPGLECRPMFGGHGLYCGETFFGIIHRGQLFFKVSSDSLTEFTSRRSGPFRPTAKQTLASYYEVPAEILEDRQRLCQWALTAVAAARDEGSRPKGKQRARRRG